jgi:uncharacterized protein
MTQATPRNRDLAPDVLRGFALLGILLVNLSYFSHDSFEGIAWPDVAGGGNQAATMIMLALFQGKFYLLFSFLFGYSSLYITKGEKTGRGRWVGRSVVLIVLGILHFTFLWHGDILFLYGVFGLLLVAFMFRSDKALKVWAWVLWGFSAFLLTSLSFLIWLGEQAGFETPPVEEVELNEVMRGGSYIDSLMPRVELWTLGVTGGVLLQGGLVFAAFLVGILAARKKLLTSGSEHLKLRTMLVWGLGVGLPLQVLAAWLYVSNELSPTGTESTYFGALTIGFMTAPLLSMAYLALTVIALQRIPQAVSWLRFPGRMALSNYLAQSVALSLIFGPWGLGLFGRVDYWVAFVIAIGVFGALSLASIAWLRVFQQGPMEWLVGVVTRRPQRV